MNADVNNWLNLLFRWLHVIAGIMWIGHLWFFNFVNAQVAKTYDADTKKKVVPELMPRALYWFRWGAAYTFITGILLLAFVYYMDGHQMVPEGSTRLSNGAASLLSLAVLVIGFLIYDVMWKAMAKQEVAGAAVSFVLVTAVAFGLAQVFVGRSVFIHIGAIFGTIMAGNVWMRIWPNQRKIIAATREGKAPDAALVASAGMRSKQNTYMSMPLMFFMVSNHFPTIYGADNSWVFVPGFVAVGWIIAKFCFVKSAGKAPAQFVSGATAQPATPPASPPAAQAKP